MAQPWWKDVITQAFNPPVEPGQDIGTPYGTDVTALQSGTVKSLSYGGFGERIDITTGPSTVEYYQHLDQIAPGLHAGSQVTAGELLGESGGQLYGGMHPNSRLNSSGPHIEVGELVGGQPVDPSQLIAAGPQIGIGGGGGSSASAGGTQSTRTSQDSGGGGGLVNINFPDPIASLRDWFSSGVTQTKSNLSGGTGFIADNIIPLVVAALIILVVLGAGNKTQTQTQVIPMPVPV